jgi:hypothetical protein
MHTRFGSKLAAGALGLVLLAATSAPAQTSSNAPAINPLINCSAPAGGCTIYKYGFGAPDSYTNGEPNPWDLLAKSHNSYSGSYFYSRNNTAPGAVNCIAERGFVPVVGQVLIREESDCLPPVLGAGVCRNCTPGAGNCTNGTPCTSGFDCPQGLCNNIDAGCPVEIASDLGTPGQDIVFGSGFVNVTAVPGFGTIWVSTAFNGAMVTDGPGLWDPDRRLGIGRRFQRPGGGTQVIWVDQLNGGGNNGVGENYSTLCCNDNRQDGALCSGQLFNKYPNLTLLPERANEGRNEQPWLYASDRPDTGLVEGNWELDPEFTVPGQVHGNCSLDRRIGCSRPGALSNASCTAAGLPHFCCTGAGTGNCGTECIVGGGTVNLGPCDLRERGWRFNRALSSLTDGSPDPGKCNASPFVFRGTLNQFCSVVVAYNECLALDNPETCVVPAGKRIGRCTDSVPGDGVDTTLVRCSPGPSPFPLTANGNLRWGDPGPDCAIRNYGPQMRPDINCDGIEDNTIDTNGDGTADQIGDSCPYYTEINSVDLNPSPAINTFNRVGSGPRADECECGDSNRDGLVTVADIVDINAKIFTPPAPGTPAQGNADLSAPLSDTNEDGLFNVSDIVGVNIDIFSPLQTSRCGRAPIIGE